MNFSLETSGMIPRFGWIAGYTSTSPRHYVSERCSQALRRGPEPAPPKRVQKPTAEAGAAAIWRSPRRRLTLPARLPSDILTLQSKGHLNLVATPANTPKLFLVVAIEGAPFDDYMPQRKAGVCTGASQRRFISSSSIDTVTEQPAISSDVTKLPTSDRVTMLPAGSSNRRTTSYIR